MPTLIELVTQVVTAQASASAMSTEQIIDSLTKIHITLGQLESGVPDASTAPATTHVALDIGKAFKKNEIICMICGKGGFHMLTSHIKKVHGLKPSDYRKKFAIPKNQPLCSKIHSDNLKERAAKLVRYVQMAKVEEPIPEATAVKAARRGRPAKVKTPEVPANEMAKVKVPIPEATAVKAARRGRPAKVKTPQVSASEPLPKDGPRPSKNKESKPLEL